jgi:geranylgeranyl pyrophosphate synthase
MNKTIENYNSIVDFDKEVFTSHGDVRKGKTTIKMLYAYSEDTTDKEIADFFLEQIYQVMVENHDKEEIYERIKEMENKVTEYLKQIKYWE